MLNLGVENGVVCAVVVLVLEAGTVQGVVITQIVVRLGFKYGISVFLCSNSGRGQSL